MPHVQPLAISGSEVTDAERAGIRCGTETPPGTLRVTPGGSALPYVVGVDLKDRLGDYPGRGLALLVDDSKRVGWVYFVTGRSESSRARTIERANGALLVRPTTGDATDELRHYACARTVGHRLVVGNGDHVDVIATGVQASRTLDAVIEAIDPEPDPPIHTPRIAFVLHDQSEGDMAVTATVVTVHRQGDQVVRRSLPLHVQPGSSMLVTTYNGDRDEPNGTAPIHTFDRTGDLPSFVDELWEALPPDLRVLAVSGMGATTSLVEIRP